LLRLQHLAQSTGGKAVSIPWYVMTSGPTRADTEAFFVQQKYFGLDKSNVIFFEQGVLPALTMDGHIILEDKDKISVAPDGNGGVYAALRVSGVLSDMKKRGKSKAVLLSGKKICRGLCFYRYPSAV
jgi:UDP-N-acetylglucosamine/UDP-N-acetylgalactosamine diphosphorylase